MGSDSIPPELFLMRGLVCAHKHSIARTQKMLTFTSYTGECQQQKHTQHVPSTKTVCDYLYGWIKKNGLIRKKISFEMVNPRDLAGELRRRSRRIKRR